jgi:hypothetical protein
MTIPSLCFCGRHNDLILRSGLKGRVSKDGPNLVLRDARKSALLRMRSD